MMKLKARTEFEESIQASCRSLFLTSAIPDLVNSEGTMKQPEFPDHITMHQRPDRRLTAEQHPYLGRSVPVS